MSIGYDTMQIRAHKKLKKTINTDTTWI